MFRPAALAGAVVLAAGLLAARPAAADVASAERDIQNVATDIASLARDANVRVGEDRSQFVEEKLADADMFFQLGFYEESSILYLDIVENYPDQTAYADALFRLGESLYLADDPYGAREYFEKLLQQSSESRFRPYVQQALSRLIEIGISLEDFAGIERYFTELNRLPAADVAAITPYFRGKYYFFQGNLAEAERAFLAVPDNAEYTLRARYFLGVVYVKRGDLDRALQAFKSVLLTPASTDEDKKTVDLAYLAIGRILYEQHQEDQALESYQHISTDSPYFDAALYEVAWVHLGRGDTTKARRSLEMLVIYDPDSRYAPEAKLLLGNILLREGRVVLDEECFLLDTERRVAEAQGGAAGTPPPELPAQCTVSQPGAGTASTNFSIDAFRSVKTDYGPVFSQIQEATASREQLRDYFSQMVHSDSEAASATNLLPTQARAWFEQDESVARVQGVLDGLAAIRRYMTDTERLATQLQTMLSGDSAVGAFTELRGVRDRAILAANRCARIRAALAAVLDGVSAPAGAATDARTARRQLDRQVAQLPVDADGMSSEYQSQRDAIDAISHTLTETTHTIELVNSMSAALDQYLGDTSNWGNMGADEIAAIQSELRLVHGAVEHYREQSTGMRQQVDVLRAQVQVGTITAEQAADIRDRHRDAVARELGLLGGAAAGGVVGSVAGALDDLARTEADLGTVLQTLEGHAQDRSRVLLAAVNEERAKLDADRARLAAVEDTAAGVVGGYAVENFEAIAGRFEDLILRSDVGLADSAWSLAEEHRRRVTQMGQQRDRDLESIQMEYNDLLGN